MEESTLRIDTSQAIELAEPIECLGYQSIGASLESQILNVQGCPIRPKFFDQSRSRLRLQSMDNDSRSFGDGPPGDRLADSGTTPRYNDYLVLQALHGLKPE